MLEISRPAIGYYKMRRVRKGPWVPIRIERRCHCTIGGGEDEPHTWTPACDRYPQPSAIEAGWREVDVQEIWNRCYEISQEEYDFLVARGDWARSYAPDLPEANPERPIHLDRMPPLF